MSSPHGIAHVYAHNPSLQAFAGVVAWLVLCHSREGGNPVKKYKYNKFLKLKARFISLYAGFPPSRE
ncbi:MAG TPA: hypothetical protein LFV92_07390 [Rickettsia endosymbiont of Ceroptres masudai]|nr:hypothetical protein [Rickettsia endosymbiont of Ceroptres masudai]